MWGSHPLIPAIACLLVGKTAADLAGPDGSVSLAALRRSSVGGRRERGGVADWMAHQLNTGPFPGNHVCGGREGGRVYPCGVEKRGLILCALELVCVKCVG